MPSIGFVFCVFAVIFGSLAAAHAGADIELTSKLDFSANSTFADDADVPGQLRLRASRYWGRLYIDGWPQPVQYLQAHFGDSPPIGRLKFAMSTPADACSELTPIATGKEHVHVLFAKRGTCTFGKKALTAQRSGAAGVIIINNEPGIDHLPITDKAAYDLTDFAVLSIAMDEGRLIEGYLSRYGELTGYVVPINCDHKSPTCLPATVQERQFVSNPIDGGHLKHADLSIEYLLAQFGVKVLPASVNLKVVHADPAEACGNSTAQWLGAAVVVKRGGCSFLDKAKAVQLAGGAAMILDSGKPYPISMGVEPRWQGLRVAIPVVSVSETKAKLLVDGAEVRFEEAVSREVSASGWEAVERVFKGQGDESVCSDGKCSIERAEVVRMARAAEPPPMTSINAEL